MSISIGQAFFGGVSAFFSEWIFCLLQIFPFFLAFTVGAAVSDKKEVSRWRQWRNVFLIAMVPLAGYSLFFIPMGMTTTTVSKILFRYLEIANQFGGVFIGLAGFYLIGLLTFRESSAAFARRLRLGAGFFLGASLALAYKPCVTPTLTVISSLSSAVETANIGAVMLGFYTLGTSLVILVSGMLLAMIANLLLSAAGKTFVRRFCGVVLITASFLIISGKMTDYKSFLVGRFAPQVSGVIAPLDFQNQVNVK